MYDKYTDISIYLSYKFKDEKVIIIGHNINVYR